MMPKKETQTNLIRDLGDGLVLRRSTPGDADRLAEFNGRIHSDEGPENPDDRVSAWVRDLLTRPHPTFDPGDFTVVEEPATGQIVSSMNLISQTWTFGGIPFKVGRPELVGTLPDYRNRGLVRQQFDLIHQWSAERGELVQAITGIPYYYRQFGYEMAMTLSGGRAGYLPSVPKLKEGESEPYTFRQAQESDLPFLKEMYDQASRRSLVSCVYDDQMWNYELSGKSQTNVNRLVYQVIEAPSGEPVGVVAHPPFAWTNMMPALFYEVRPGISWAMVTPSVIRFLIATGAEYLKDQAGKAVEAFGFWMGTEHPVYDILHDRLPRVHKPYAWYMRVPDLPAFLSLTSPVLERRLASSPLQSHTGELKLTFYRDGLRLVFKEGRLAQVDPHRPEPFGHSGDAAFPGLTFLHLLFGYHTYDELREVFPDVFCRDDEVYALINALFPKQYVNILPVA